MTGTWAFIVVIAVIGIFVLVRKKGESVTEYVSPQPAVVPVVDEGLSPSIVAALTAAISIITGQPASKFRFSAIRHASSGQPMSAWGFMGNADIMTTRQSYLERKGN